MKLKQYAARWGIRIYRFSNNSNHLHLFLRATTRLGFQNFLRVFSAQVATFVTGARKGKAFSTRFWDRLAFSRVVEWGKSFFTAKEYVEMNDREAPDRFRINLESPPATAKQRGGSDLQPQDEDGWEPPPASTASTLPQR